MYAEIMQALATEIEGALGVNVVKGFPAWGRPNLSPPVAALLAEQVEVAEVGRISAYHMSIIWRVIVFARHEQEMLTLLEALVNWARETRTIRAGNSTHLVEFQGGSRYMGTTGAQQEDHGFALVIRTMI